jgi:hypothetical protein
VAFGYRLIGPQGKRRPGAHRGPSFEQKAKAPNSTRRQFVCAREQKTKGSQYIAY